MSVDSGFMTPSRQLHTLLSSLRLSINWIQPCETLTIVGLTAFDDNFLNLQFESLAF